MTWMPVAGPMFPTLILPLRMIILGLWDSSSGPVSTISGNRLRSMFGIIDLASIPKDRFYLYRSIWNRENPTLHILPHWNWEGHEGREIPVFVYTSWSQVELFVNGVSQGVRRKAPGTPAEGLQTENHEERYRLIWDGVKYEKGELKAVAYDRDGNVVAEETVRTAGKPHHIEIVNGLSFTGVEELPVLKADGKDLCYLTVRIVDKVGNLCPGAGHLVEFSVTGAASYKAAANGDPTCLDIFHQTRMHAFGGMLTVILQAGETPGEATIKAYSKGLRSASVSLGVMFTEVDKTAF